MRIKKVDLLKNITQEDYFDIGLASYLQYNHVYLKYEFIKTVYQVNKYVYDYINKNLDIPDYIFRYIDKNWDYNFYPIFNNDFIKDSNRFILCKRLTRELEIKQEIIKKVKI